MISSTVSGRASQQALDSLRSYLKDASTTMLESTRGEWNLVYWERDGRKLVFGRDLFGRKSLCWRIVEATTEEGDGRLEQPRLQISALPGESSAGWRELHPGTSFILHSTVSKQPLEVRFYPNPNLPESLLEREDVPEVSLNVEAVLPANFTTQLSLEVLCYYSLRELQVDGNECFLNQFKAVTHRQLCGGEKYFGIRAPLGLTDTSHLSRLIEQASNEFLEQLEDAVDAIIRSLPPTEPSPSLSILFSGGVDSLTVAAMTGKVMKEGVITLVNVAFGESAKEFNAVPDRGRGIKAYKWLEKRHPGLYRLLLVDVLKKELAICRQEYIAKTIAPCQTVLDDSLGCVLWFATRARGNLYGNGEAVTGEEIGPVMLVGSGADEQLGGYGRHRTVFEKEGWEGLKRELEMEMRRIGARNLGRDDRVGTANGRVLIAPFLEERFVAWLSQIPLDLKVDFSKPRGHGEKRLLRLALRRLGAPDELVNAPKQAMQFGSRVARLEKSGERGSDKCHRLAAEDAN